MKRHFIVFALFFAGTVFWDCQKQPGTSQITPSPDEPQERQLIRHSGTVKYGDTLDKILSRENLSRELSLSVINAFHDVFDVRKILPQREYHVLRDSTGQFVGFEYLAEQGKKVIVSLDSTGNFCGDLDQIPLKTKRTQLKGYITSTLYESILSLGESPELIVAFSDVFQWDVDFFVDPRDGDEFRIIYEKVYLVDPTKPDSLGEFLRYGRILAGQYTLSGKNMTAIYFENKSKEPGFYDLDGKSFQKTFLKSPLNYRKITSRFSGARLHPVLKTVRAHYAVDYAAPTGTPVSAAANGTVIDKGYSSGLGNYIKIQHTKSHFSTLYGHLSRFASGIAVGSYVNQRDVIGYVGQTGLATGPHLHYVMYENGRPINPLRVKNASGDPILPENLTSFVEVKNEMLMLLSRAQEPHYRSPFAHIYPPSLSSGRQGMSAR